MSDTRIDDRGLEDSAEDAAFRLEVRRWLEANAPAEPGSTPSEGGAWTPASQSARAWQARLVDAGLAAVEWAAEYGGREGTARQQSIVDDELAAAGLTPRARSIGIAMVAPTIMVHGTDEQKRRFVPATLRGDLRWCQLYSEPGAGSDLAGLSTRAVLDGDEWVVNGQKVWTTQAHEADYAILLARTNPDVPKHRGISYFLLDMHQAAVEVRPLRQITGDAHFNEVFLTDARVEADNLLGDQNAGWGVAMTTLAYERVLMGGSVGSGRPGIHALVELARHHGRDGDPVIRQGLAAAYTGAELLRFLGLRMQSARRGQQAPAPSLLKLFNAHHQKRLNELALTIEGPYGTLSGSDGPEPGSWQYSFLSAVQLRIAGGSDEIQRNVIGERILGLPGEPRADKEIPFRDVLKNATADRAPANKR
ncbi:MAG TPA: acyl-CoA dehydrogenase family protein [Acidimicrobiales bacterium]